VHEKVNCTALRRDTEAEGDLTQIATDEDGAEERLKSRSFEEE